MRNLRDIVRLKLQCQSSERAIATACGLSPSTAAAYVARINEAGLSWRLPAELDKDAAPERLLFPQESNRETQRLEPDWTEVHAQLRRKRMKKMLLWQEYREQHPDGSPACAGLAVRP